MTTTLLHGGTILTGADGAEPIEEGWLLVEDECIAAVGDCDPPAADEVIDASGMLVVPGFVNAHTHLCMIYGRSLGADRNLLGWLGEAQIPVMRELEPRDYALSMKLGGGREPQGGQHDDLRSLLLAPLRRRRRRDRGAGVGRHRDPIRAVPLHQ